MVSKVYNLLLSLEKLEFKIPSFFFMSFYSSSQTWKVHKSSVFTAGCKQRAKSSSSLIDWRDKINPVEFTRRPNCRLIFDRDGGSNSFTNNFLWPSWPGGKTSSGMSGRFGLDIHLAVMKGASKCFLVCVFFFKVYTAGLSGSGSGMTPACGYTQRQFD